MASQEAVQYVNASSGSAVRNAGYLVGGQILSSALLLPTGIVLARALGPAGKGYYDIAVGSAMLLVIFTGLSLPSGVFFYAAKAPLDWRRLLLFLTGLVLASGLLIIGVLATFGDTRLLSWMLPRGSQAKGALTIGLLLVVLQSQQFAQAVAKGRGKFKAFAISDVLARAITLGAAVTLFITGVTDPEAYVLGLGVATMLAVLLLTPVIAAPGPRRALPIREMVLYSLPLFVGNLVQFLNYRVDIFFLQSFAGLSAVGIYTVAVWFAQIIWLVPNAIGSLILRAAAEEQERGGAIKQVAMVNRGCFALSAIMGIGLMVVGSVLIPPVFGSEFRRSVQALLLLTPGTVLFCPTILLSAYLNGIQRQAATTWVACGALVITLVLNVLLVPRLGITGAALTSTCSYAVSTIATIYVVRRQHPWLSIRALLLPQPADIRLVLSAIRSRVRRVREPSWDQDRRDQVF
jgi:O-antigen/teichoic acid export membrane protein